MLLAMTACLIAIAGLQGVPLYRTGQRRDLLVFALLWFLAAAAGYAYTLGWTLAPVNAGVTAIFGPLLQAIRQVLTGGAGG